MTTAGRNHAYLGFLLSDSCFWSQREFLCDQKQESGIILSLNIQPESPVLPVRSEKYFAEI